MKCYKNLNKRKLNDFMIKKLSSKNLDPTSRNNKIYV